MRTVQKVKIKGDTVEIKYAETNSSGTADVVLKSDDPHGDFKNAMGELRGHVVSICELRKSQAAALTITGVTVKRQDDILSATITAGIHLTGVNADMNINTPHLKAEPVDENDHSPLMGADTADAVEKVVEEANAYLEGKRGQGDLFSGKDDKAA
jgi:hypothetical protein